MLRYRWKDILKYILFWIAGFFSIFSDILPVLSFFGRLNLFGKQNAFTNFLDCAKSSCFSEKRNHPNELLHSRIPFNWTCRECVPFFPPHLPPSIASRCSFEEFLICKPKQSECLYSLKALCLLFFFSSGMKRCWDCGKLSQFTSHSPFKFWMISCPNKERDTPALLLGIKTQMMIIFLEQVLFPSLLPSARAWCSEGPNFCLQNKSGRGKAVLCGGGEGQQDMPNPGWCVWEWGL